LQLLPTQFKSSITKNQLKVLFLFLVLLLHYIGLWHLMFLKHQVVRIDAIWNSFDDFTEIVRLFMPHFNV